MLKRSLFLLLIASIGTTLQGIKIFNKTGQRIVVIPLLTSNHSLLPRDLEINNNCDAAWGNDIELIKIIVDLKVYFIGCNSDMDMIVGRQSDGFIQITYMPIQKKGVIY